MPIEGGGERECRRGGRTGRLASLMGATHTRGDPMSTPLLVSTDWLAARLGAPGLRVADCRWTLLDRNKGRDGYARGHVAGAVFCDVDRDLAAPPGQGPGRHPLPKPEAFTAVMLRAGVDTDTHVVAYDFGDGSTAARLWWLLRYFGHEHVSLLDGGMARWEREGRALESVEPTFPPGSFVAVPHPAMVLDAAAVGALGRDPSALLIDSRLPERYQGRVEPVDPAAGHIPGAKNRPYPSNLRAPDDPRFLAPAELRTAFAALGADQESSVVCYCGSGINACQNLFALRLAGYPEGLLYEGSWSDWCSDPAREVVTASEA
jgi:thiosulfate/3-mercaptopyruvate sulfurtransferase